MNALVLVLISIIAFSIAYVTYGAWLTKQWGVDDTIATPAHTRADGVDYVPASAPVLLGHHFASIAGAGPITGPIAAAVLDGYPYCSGSSSAVFSSVVFRITAPFLLLSATKVNPSARLFMSTWEPKAKSSLQSSLG